MGYHLRIKICGVTNPDDAQAAVRYGADALGLNFYPPSPRYLTMEKADAILRELPPFTDAVGVFVNEAFADILQRLKSLERLRTIQWHGQTHEVRELHPYQRIAAFPVRDAESLIAIQRYLDACRLVDALPAAVLVDAHVAGEYGGTGKAAPWDLLATFRPGIPVILAGGLTPVNVADAVRIVQPWGVDVASGVESSPGKKDADKMRRFIDAARQAALHDGR